MRLQTICLFAFLVSCTNNSADERKTDTDSKAPTDVTTPESAYDAPEFERLIWATEFDTSRQDFMLKQHKRIDADTLIPEDLVKKLNMAWPEISLVLKKISNDTIYVSIPNSFYLTQSIGSTGAGNYISSTTYNLTELKGITYVHFDFKEGDHFAPGTFTRDDFKNYR